MAVLLETSLGDLTIDLHSDLCPTATKNFLKLCKIKYYNNCIFHKVQKDFMVQTGDPTGTGKGGESIYHKLYGDQAKYFDDEIHKKLKHNKVGTVSFVNKGPNTNASQFFITTGPNLDFLDEKYTIFGEVSEGLDILEKINSAFCDEGGRPLQNIRIRHTIVLDDPFPDPPLLAPLIPIGSPVPMRDELDVGYIAADEQLGEENAGLSDEQIAKRDAAKEAGSRATALEMLGDLPTADIAPPENVLFIAQIHPTPKGMVTKDEDLHLIFSRFGNIKSCEIIRDWKTGESLQYAFIEFETAAQCEAAYFKMDNVLIDDRRIKVDFSQSVSKLWNSWRRGDKDLSGKVDSSHSQQGGPRGQKRPDAGQRSVTNNLVLKDKYQGSQHQYLSKGSHGASSSDSSKSRHSSSHSSSQSHSSSHSSSSSSAHSRRRSRSRSPRGGSKSSRR